MSKTVVGVFCDDRSRPSRFRATLAFAKTLCAIGLLATPFQSSAEPFRNDLHGYAFDMPAGWRFAHHDFMLTNQHGASLTESSLPPKAQRSLQKLSMTAGMMACIGADYHDTDERISLEGPDWTGIVSVFIEPRRNKQAQRHILQFVAQAGDKFRLFYLGVPSHQWTTDRSSALAVLKSLKFHHQPVSNVQ